MDIDIKLTKRDSSGVELSRFSGIFDMVSTEIRLILSMFVATDLNANFTKPIKKRAF